MTDRVLFQTNDELSETNLTERRARKNSTDYVERGLGLAVDYSNNTVDISSGHAVILDGTQAYDVFPDARSGLSLPAGSGMNYVYLTIDPSQQDDISYHIDADDTPPATPSLKIGEVDTVNDAKTGVNQAPDAEYESLTSNTHSTDEVSSETTNNVEIASPGEVQSKIDNLASQSSIGVGDSQSRGVVKLVPTATYDEGGEIHVKPGITLDFNGAILTHSTDHNLIFVDNAGKIKNGRLDIEEGTLTGDAIVLDTSRSTYGKYTIDASDGQKNSHATVEATIIGGNSVTPTGAGLALRDAADAGITQGCYFDVTIAYMNEGVLLRSATGSGYNTVQMDVSVTACVTNISQPSGGGAATIHGQIQPTTVSDYGIRNQTTNPGPRFTGRLWDPDNYSQYAVAGQGITVVGQRQALDAAAHADGAADQWFIAYAADGYNMLVMSDGTDYYSFADDNGVLTFRINFENTMQVKANGSYRPQRQDLSTLSPGYGDDGWMFQHNGTASITLYDGTTTSKVGYYVWDNTNNGWRTVVNF